MLAAGAATGSGKRIPSRPAVIGVVVLVLISTWRVAAVPIRYTASTLPTRSTTAMVALVLRACASAMACARTVCTSLTVRLEVGVAQLPLQLGVVSVPVRLCVSLPDEQAPSNMLIIKTVYFLTTVFILIRDCMVNPIQRWSQS